MAVKGLFTGWFEEEPKDESADKNKAASSKSKPTSAPRAGTQFQATKASSSTYSVIKPDKPDEEYLKVLQQHFDKLNLEGMDYHEFGTILRKGHNQGKPLSEAIKDAFTAVTAMDNGLTTSTLLDNINYYSNGLSDLAKEFEMACNEKIAKAKNDSNAEITRINSQLAKLVKEEEELTLRLKQINESRSQLSSKKLTAENEFGKVEGHEESRKAKMQIALNALQEAFNSDANLIKTHLK